MYHEAFEKLHTIEGQIASSGQSQAVIRYLNKILLATVNRTNIAGEKERQVHSKGIVS
jgi:uncharacterized Zn finger protein